MNSPDDLQFARRPSKIYQRLVVYILLAAGVAYMDWLVARLAYVSVRGSSKSPWIVISCTVFVGFMIVLLIYSSKTVLKSFADRKLPLIVISNAGVILYRMNPIVVPWDEITSATLERAVRGSTVLRLGVRDPTVSELNGPGRVINLQPLADQPANLLTAIQLRLRRTQGCV